MLDLPKYFLRTDSNVRRRTANRSAPPREMFKAASAALTNLHYVPTAHVMEMTPVTVNQHKAKVVHAFKRQHSTVFLQILTILFSPSQVTSPRSRLKYSRSSIRQITTRSPDSHHHRRPLAARSSPPCSPQTFSPSQGAGRKGFANAGRLLQVSISLSQVLARHLTAPWEVLPRRDLVKFPLPTVSL